MFATVEKNVHSQRSEQFSNNDFPDVPNLYNETYAHTNKPETCIKTPCNFALLN